MAAFGGGGGGFGVPSAFGSFGSGAAPAPFAFTFASGTAPLTVTGALFGADAGAAAPGTLPVPATTRGASA